MKEFSEKISLYSSTLMELIKMVPELIDCRALVEACADVLRDNDDASVCIACK